MTITTVPNELRTLIGSEEVDFVVKAHKNSSNSTVLNHIFFGVFWLTILSFGFYSSLKKQFEGLVFDFSTAFFQNIYTLIKTNIKDDSLFLFFGLFVSIGVGVLVYAVYLYFQKGGFFIGTATRLIKYRKGNITTTDWEQFSGNIAINNKGTLGNIKLELRTGNMQNSGGNSSSKRYVPDVIRIVGIENVLSVETKCRQRIKENDPTPVVSGRYS
ncbi:MAG TPA: hypothetical protein DDZ39_03210 [Flavobacteriaceae bacterium]|jgi:hypothetical protein|nr:hypothetical protein [Flavobacteriaceae bacterium]